MAKFDLKKAILENKATFFSSLTEGQFSWMTQDTGQQIGSEEENTIPVYMFDNKGNFYYEKNYDGYGDFGGKDYYELLAQMNGYAKGDRMDGIDMAFGKMKTPNGGPVLFPALVVKPNEFDYKTHDFTKEAETDPNQSWYAPEEEDFIDQNDEEVYGYDEEEELDENKENLKESVKILDRQADLDQAYFNLDVDGTEMGFSYWDYDEEFDNATYEEVMYMIEKQLINTDKYGFPVDPQLTPEQKEEIAQVVLKDLQTNPGWKSNLKENNETKPTTKMKKSDLKAKIKEQTDQFKKGDKVNYDGEKNLIVNILKDGSPVLVPMSSIDDEAFSVDSDEISNPKLYFKVNYDGEKHLVVNILDDGSPVLVPMSVIDDEAFSIDSDEIETPMTENVTTKMKKSDLKNKIKEMILNEMEDEKVVDVNDETPESEEDFLAELEGMLSEASEFDMNKPARIKEFIIALNRLVDEYHSELYLNDDLFAAISMVIKAAQEEAMNLKEAEGDEEVTDDVTTDDVAVDDTETIDTTTTTEVNPDVKAVQDSLTQAQAAAQKLGDPKLTDQIGNTITFFTRNHVVEKGAVAENLNEADEIELGNMQYVLDWWEELPFEKKKEIFHKEHEAEDDINRFRMNESMFPMLKKILK